MTEFAIRLEFYEQYTLVEMAIEANEHDEQVRAVNRVALAFVHYDPAAFDIIQAYATQAPAPFLREAAVNAMGFRAWPQFRPLLEQIIRQDSDERVRRRAASILQFVPSN